MPPSLPSPPAPLQFGPFVLDPGNARLLRDGRPLDIAPKPFAVLCHLAARPGALVTKNELLDAVWGHRHVSESVLKKAVNLVRMRLGDDPRAPRYIETANRRGYRFVAASPPVPVAVVPVHPVHPLRTPGVPAGPLVGRGTALGWLDARLDAALGGRRIVAWVAGEAGIGKSVLLARWRERRDDGTVRFAAGQCVESSGLGEPYLPLLEALNDLADGPGAADAVALMREVAPTWLVQLPWLLAAGERAALQAEIAATGSRRMLHELGELLDRLAARQPLVVVLEDLHWSDDATVRALDDLARRASPARLLVVGSLRPVELAGTAAMLRGVRQELRLHGLCDELPLDAFSALDVAGYLAQRFGGRALPERFARTLHEHTDGLPLFVVKVVDNLVQAGLLARGNAGWSVRDDALAQLSLPEDLAGAIEKQIGRLPGELRDMLEAAAVCGVSFDHRDLARALPLDPDLLQARLDGLARRGEWICAAGVEDGGARYVFRHALFRHVFYRRCSEPRRVRLHRALAEAIASRLGDAAGDAAAELALHCERGGLYTEAMHHCAAAAARAMERYAAAEAVGLAARGLALLPSAPQGTPRDLAEHALQRLLGEAQGMAGATG